MGEQRIGNELKMAAGYCWDHRGLADEIGTEHGDYVGSDARILPELHSLQAAGQALLERLYNLTERAGNIATRNQGARQDIETAGQILSAQCNTDSELGDTAKAAVSAHAQRIDEAITAHHALRETIETGSGALLNAFGVFDHMLAAAKQSLAAEHNVEEAATTSYRAIQVVKSSVSQRDWLHGT